MIPQTESIVKGGKKLSRQITLNVTDDGNFESELKTVEIDVERKIFKINGVPFGAGCTTLCIYSEPNDENR